MRRATAVAWGIWTLGAVVGVVGLGFERIGAAGFDRMAVLVSVSQGSAVVAISVVGLIVAGRQPSNPLGWLYLCFWVLMGVGSLASGYGHWATVIHAGAGGGVFAVWLNNWLWVPALTILLSFPFLLFPDGHLLSPRWRIVGGWTASTIFIWSIAFAFAGHDYTNSAGEGVPNPYTPVALVPFFDLMRNLGGILFISALVACLASLFVRFRRADGQGRAQIKWLFLAGTVTLGFLLVTGSHKWNKLDDVLMGFVLVLIPISVGVAVTRYHLFDIDRVISRTAAYAVVTGLLLATYAAVAASISAIVGKGSTIAVAAATLTAAAVARPVLLRVQAAVDRRFNRSRYDAIHTVDAFGTRLRNQVDPHHVSEDLVTTVNATLQPNHITVWIRQPT